ncbi:MAG: MFS transporter [Syntrophales bacterium]|nr:MFS transporter [Syntrophales bacterium]
MNKYHHPALPTGRRLLLVVVGPFACGYFLSYLLRNINAIIAPDLVSAFRLDASDLGLLTSVYFFTFGLSQPLLGVLLDRFGPRRVEGSLLLIAAAGALIFAWSGSTAMLVVGRGLIGLGVCACFMAGLQVNAIWFPPERLAALNGYILAAGGLGTIFSTAPAEWLLRWVDWRTLFIMFAAAFAIVSVLIFRLVPERPGPKTHASPIVQFKGFLQVGKSREFWRIAPLTMFSQSTYMALQGLWAGRWMNDVGGFPRDDIANYLLAAAVGMALGHLIMGSLASRLERGGIAPSYVVGAGGGVGIVVQAVLAAGYSEWQPLIWLLFGFFGTAGTVNYAILARSFPVALIGRASTALNLLVFAITFLIQWGMGAVINLYPAGPGGYSPAGYAVSFGATAVLQAVVLCWYFYRLPRKG